MGVRVPSVTLFHTTTQRVHFIQEQHPRKYYRYPTGHSDAGITTLSGAPITGSLSAADTFTFVIKTNHQDIRNLQAEIAWFSYHITPGSV
ncbi:MAG: hypothetical protein CMJ20_12660 [Phycisphaeraceae bacterium]|nr:hypothetical protein [Phycisphaeraceae bacterium]